MTTVSEAATVMYALADDLEAAADKGQDATSLITMGMAFVQACYHQGGLVGMELQRPLWIDSCASFMRAWARHVEPEQAGILVQLQEGMGIVGQFHGVTQRKLD